MATGKKKTASKGKSKLSGASCTLLCILALAIGFVGGFYVATGTVDEIKSDPIVSGDLSIHFLELGNKYTGDCTYIKAGDVDILIDAGSRVASIPYICEYIDEYVTDGVLEYVIVTHAHEDHYAGFATNENTDSIFDLYVCETIIDFALTNHSEDATMYSNYIRERDAEIEAGATHYTAAECIEQGKNEFELGNEITLEILDSYYYTNQSSGENNYSVCTLIRQGDRKFLFTGDLESKGEEYLVKMNDIGHVDVYKAGHHGSSTSTTETLLSAITPDHICICCCAGSPEYTKTAENQFPTQEFVDRVSKYTDSVYVTTLCVDYKEGVFESFNGNITVISDGSLEIECSASDLKLKDSDWFKDNRECPDEWK